MLSARPLQPAGRSWRLPQRGHAGAPRRARLAEDDLDHGGERDREDRADDAEDRAGDLHGDDRREGRQLDRPSVDDVVLDRW
jgi:hypothetical protein